MMQSQKTEATGDDSRRPVAVRSASIHVPKTAELVAGALRLLIVRGELTEGDNLPPESALMQQFDVSRPTLREAFRILESEQLITVRRGARGGAQVRMPTGDNVARYAALVLQYRGATVRDVYQARAVLEPACARMLAERRSAADLDVLRRAVEREEQEADHKRILEQPSFHRLVMELSGNKTLFLLSEVTHRICYLATVSQLKSESDRTYERRAAERLQSWHASLVELVEQRNGPAAEKLWADHLAETDSFMVEGIRTQTVLDLFS
jgi:DNA-binding FadR family transcriptional regulator